MKQIEYFINHNVLINSSKHSFSYYISKSVIELDESFILVKFPYLHEKTQFTESDFFLYQRN